MFGCFADGATIPIYVVYKSKLMWDSWVSGLSGGPLGTRYNRTSPVSLRKERNAIILSVPRHLMCNNILVLYLLLIIACPLSFALGAECGIIEASFNLNLRIHSAILS